MPPKKTKRKAETQASPAVSKKRGRKPLPPDTVPEDNDDDSAQVDNQTAPGPDTDAIYDFQSTLDLSRLEDYALPEWTPATDEEVAAIVAKYKASNESKLNRFVPNIKRYRIRAANWDWKDLSTFDLKVKWWDKNWSYTEPKACLPSNDPKLRQAVEKHRMPGQTYFFQFGAAPVSNDLCASLLGFHSVKAYLTWLDTQGGPLFGALSQQRLEGFKPNGERAEWAKLPDILRCPSDHAALHNLLRAISRMSTHRTFRIRMADLDPTMVPVDHRHRTAISATILANTLAALMFSTKGPSSSEYRIPRMEGEAGTRVPYIHGFHADLWLGMLAAGANNIHYRRDGKYQLDGAAGNTTDTAAIPRFQADQMTGLVTAEVAAKLPSTVVLQQSTTYLDTIRSLDDPDAENQGDNDGAAEVTMESVLAKVARRMTRLDYICSARGACQNMTAKAAATKKSKGGDSVEVPRLPPMDAASVRIVLERVDTFHGVPECYEPDEQSIQALSSLVGQSDGSLISFLGAQESVADRLLALRAPDQSSRERKGKDLGSPSGSPSGSSDNGDGHDSSDDEDGKAGKDLSPEEKAAKAKEEAQEEIRKCIEHSWVMGQMLSSHPPKEVPFATVLEAFDLDPEKPGRDNLQLNPKVNPQFTAMHHQLVDAYIAWQHEKGILHGCLLANEVGTGKTITALSVIILDYLDICRKKNSGERFEARPTLMIVPAGLIGQTFDEIHKYFGGLITLKCSYGEPSDFRGIRAESTLTNNQWEEEMQYSMSSDVIRSDPTNALRVYLTTYSTAHKRWLDTEVKHVYEGDEDEDEPFPDVIRYRLPIKAQARDFRTDGDVDLEAEEMFAEPTNDVEEEEEEEVRQQPKSGRTKRTHRTKTRHVLQFTAKEGARFARLICDEAHALRHPTSSNAKVVSLMPRNAILLMTATPTLNRLSDIRGLLTQIYLSSELHAGELSYHTHRYLLEEEVAWERIQHTEGQDDEAIVPSPFRDGTSLEQIAQVIQHAQDTNTRPWAIHPEFTSQIGQNPDESDTASDRIYRAAIACVQTRRTMRDKVEVVFPPDSENPEPRTECYFPGQSIPPHKVFMEELSYKGLTAKREDFVDAANFTNYFSHKLRSGPHGEPDVLPDDNDSAAAQDSPDARINMYFHRLLVMAAFDLRTVDVTRVEDAISRNVSALDVHTLMIERPTKSYDGPAPTKAGAKKGKGRKIKKASEATVLGVEQVNNLINMDPDGGLTYVWSLVEHDRTRALPPADRPTMLYWAISKSPILTRIVRHVTQNWEVGQRTLIVVDNQYCQQLVVSILEKIGMNVGSIRASDVARQREDAVAQFTNPDTDMFVFVINASTNVSGLNLQACCWNGIIAQFFWNMSTMIQAFGRILRVGQKHECVWRILKVKGTYYDYQEDKMCRKFAETIRNEGHMPVYLNNSPMLQRIVAYEQIRVLTAQPFNRYSWCAPDLDPPGTIQEYNDYRHQRLGRFFTLIAQLLMVLPEEFRCDKDLLRDLSYYMSNLASRFAEKDAGDGEDCEEITIETLLENLEKIREEAKRKRKTSPDKKKGSPAMRTGSSKRTRSRKFKSCEFVDNSESDGEGGAESHLRRKRTQEERDEEHRAQQLEAMARIANMDDLLRDLKKPVACYPDRETAKRPLGRLHRLTRAQEEECQDLEEEMKRAFAAEDAAAEGREDDDGDRDMEEAPAVEDAASESREDDDDDGSLEEAPTPAVEYGDDDDGSEDAADDEDYEDDEDNEDADIYDA